MNSKFTEQLERIVKEHKKLTDINRIVRALGCVVVFCVVYALILPAITKERRVYCNHAEHIHTEECYAPQLVCGFEETVGGAHAHTDECYTVLTKEETKLVCGIEESEEHTHTEECYVTETVEEKTLVCGVEETGRTEEVPGQLSHIHTEACYKETLVCGMVEHAHTDECFVNPADTATSPEWAEKLPKDLSGKWSDDLLKAAKSQLGYRESVTDYELSADGIMKGYTIYGDDYGLPYADWCAMFITYCLKAAQIPAMAETDGAVYMPQGSNCKLWIDDLETAGLFRPYSEEYQPKLGDLVFLTFGGEESDHVGIVAELIFDEETGIFTSIRTIEGNCDDCVMYNNYTADDGRIVGYGELPENPNYIEKIKEEAPEIYAEAYGYSKETGEITESTPLAAPYVPPVRENLPTDEAEEDLTEYLLSEDVQPLAFSPMSLPDGGNSNKPRAEQGDLTENTNLVFDITSQISGVQLHYRLPEETDEEDWKEVKVGSTTEIPANAVFRITVIYIAVDPSDVLDNGNQILYVADPILSGLNATGEIIINGENRGVVSAGTVTVNGEKKNAVLLDFDEVWLREREARNESITGRFYFQGQLDLSQLDKEESNVITLAGIEFPVKDRGEAMAQFAEVTIEKTPKNKIIEEDGEFYLEYDIVVEAGKYGAPDVKVIDTISNNKRYTLGYENVPNSQLTEESNPKEVISTRDPSGEVGAAGTVYLTNDTEGKVGAPAQVENGNNLAWNIGDMKPFEKRVLTYRVKLDKDTYIGAPHASEPITNDASLYSKKYPRGTEHTNYIPTANATIQKTYATPRFDEDMQKWVVDYTLTVRPNDNNSFTLTNVKINDVARCVWGSGYENCMQVVPGSVKVFDGTKEITDLPSLLVGDRATAGNNPAMINNRSFDLFIGDLAVGQTKTVKYTMTLDADKAKEFANGDIGIDNTAGLYGDERKGNTQLNNANKKLVVDSQHWERKLGGAQIRNDVTVNFANKDHIYNLNGTTLIKDNNVTENGYTIPGGAIRYTILVNEQGNFDVSGAFFKDEMKDAGENDPNNPDRTPVTQFIKYIEVKVYDRRIASSNNGNEQDVLNYLNSTTPAAVYYVNVDGMKDFNFTPRDLNLPGDRDNYAFALTYYAAFDNNMSDWGMTDISNTFGISGQIGAGNGQYFNLNLNSKITKHYVEPGVEDPFKAAWYYDPTDTSFEKYGLDTGALYWVTEMSGDKIPKGTLFQESIRFKEFGNWNGANNSLPKNLLRSDKSHIGFYSANLGEKEPGVPNTIQDLYPTMAEFEAALDAGVFKEVPSTYYELRVSTNTGGTWAKDKNGNAYYDLTIEFLNTYGLLNGERLYWLVRTEPSELPPSNGQMYYSNKINYKTPTSGWSDPKSWDYQIVSDISKGIKKNVGGVYEVKNGIIKQIVDGADGHGITNLRTDIALDWATTGTDWERFRAPWPNSNSPYSNGNLREKLNPTGSFAYEDGMYVTWIVDVNSTEMLNGEYTLVDNLPEGLELMYARVFNSYNMLANPVLNNNQTLSVQRENQKRWDNYFIGPGIKNRVLNQDPPQKPISVFDGAAGYDERAGWTYTFNAPIENIEDGWTVHVSASRSENTTGWLGTHWDNRNAAIYYTKPNTETGGTDVKMYFPYLSHGNGKHVAIQFVTKVDESYLMLGDYEFDNQAKLYDKNNKLIDERGAEATVYGGSVDKNALMNGVIKDGVLTQSVFPYHIVINDDAEDMIKDSNYITLPLIDRMSSNLTLDNTSLKIYKEDTSVDINPDYVNRLTISNGTTFFVHNTNYLNGARKGNQWDNYATIYRVGSDGTLTRRDADKIYWSNNNNRKDQELQVSLLVVADDATDAKNYFDNSKSKPNDYQHINDQVLNYEYQTGVYVTYQMAIDNVDGKISGPINIVNELPAGVELCYVRTYRNSDNYSYNMTSADSSLTKSIMNTNLSATGNAVGRFAGWQEHAVFAPRYGGSNWLNTYTTYYTDGNKVGIHIPNLRKQNDNLTFQLVCRVKTTPVVTYSGQTPTKVNFNIDNPLYTDKATLVNNHLKPYVADAPRTLIYYGGMYTDKISEEGEIWYDPDQVGKVVGFIDPDPHNNPTPSGKEIVVSTGRAVDEYGNPVMYNGTQMKEIRFKNLPDETKLSIEYNVTATLSGSAGNSFTNQAFWEGHEENHDGETEEKDMKFQVGSSASGVTHGAVHIIKFNNDNESHRLAGAQFALFRAQYTQPSNDSYLLWEEGVPDEVKEHRYLAVYTRNADGVEREVVVTRDANGYITKLDGEPISSIHNKFDYYHKPVYDDDGKLVVYYDDVLAVGVTDENGNLSYGFNEVPMTEKIGSRNYQVLYALNSSNALMKDGNQIYKRADQYSDKGYYIKNGNSYVKYTGTVSESEYTTLGVGVDYKPLYNVKTTDLLMLNVNGVGERQIYRLTDSKTTKYYYENGDEAVECTNLIVVDESMYTTRPVNGNSGIMLETYKDENGYVPLFYRSNDAPVIANGKQLFMTLSAHLVFKDTDGTYKPYNGEEIDPLLYTPHFRQLEDDPDTFHDESIDKYGEDKIHFNKIYALVEISAPPGYVTDNTPHFFVVPNDVYSGIGANYFYHDEWPQSVHVCTKEENGGITYMLNVGNRMENITVTKLFDGTQLAMQPGTYRFAIYGKNADGKLTNPYTGTPMSTMDEITDDRQITSVTYTENDFGYYSWSQKNDDNSVWMHFTQENGKWYSTTHTITNGVEHVGEKTHITSDPTKSPYVVYNLLPNRIKSNEFQNLPHGTYYVYELNGAGYPITGSLDGQYGTGTINGLQYTVTVDGNALDKENPEFGKVDYNIGKTQLEFTNASYSVTMTKQFIGVAGGQLSAGVVGDYYFAIWPEEEIGQNGLPTTDATALNTQRITWKISDGQPVKTRIFNGLKKGTKYYIFELDMNRKPVPNGKKVEFNGTQFTVGYIGATDNTTPNRGTTTSGKQPVIEITNTAMVALPRTGGIGTNRIIAVGAVLMLVSVGGMLLRKKHDRKESDCP